MRREGIFPDAYDRRNSPSRDGIDRQDKLGCEVGASTCYPAPERAG
jgi:hypothetical protein